MKKLLLVDDEPFSVRMLEELFRNEWKILNESNLDSIIRLLANDSIQVIVLNAVIRRTDGEAMFQAIHNQCPDIPIIVFTSANQTRLGRSLVKKGAFWNLTMPLNTDDLAHVILMADKLNSIQETTSIASRDLTQLETGIARMFQTIGNSFPKKFTFEQDDLVQKIVELLADILQVDKASLMLLNPETQELRIKAAKGLSSYVIQNSVRKVGEGIAGWVAKEGKPLLIKDVKGDPAFSESPFYHQYSTRSLICVPLKIDDRVIGVLSANNPLSGKPFDEKDLYLTTIFSHLLLLTLHNAQLHHDRESILLREADLVALNRKITATLEPKVLFHILLSECALFFHSEFAFLFIVEEKGQEWSAHYLVENKLMEARLSPALVRQWAPHRSNAGLFNGEPERPELSILKGILQQPMSSWLCSPLIIQDKLAGSIELATPLPKRYRQEDKTFLSRISQQAALAISNARLYAKLLYSIKEITDARKEVDRVRRGDFL